MITPTSYGYDGFVEFSITYDFDEDAVIENNTISLKHSPINSRYFEYRKSTWLKRLKTYKNIRFYVFKLNVLEFVRTLKYKHLFQHPIYYFY